MRAVWRGLEDIATPWKHGRGQMNLEVSGGTSAEESIIQNEERKIGEVTEEGDGKNSPNK